MAAVFGRAAAREICAGEVLLRVTVIEEWDPDSSRWEADLNALAEVLHAVVRAGGGVSFILPFSLDEARAFWIDKVLPGARSGARRVLVARMEDEIVGTVQLLLDMPPNQRHRAEVAKLLVHPKARGRGVARALMEAVEQVARAEGRTLITLDTRTGDSAEALYLSMGYIMVGVIPRYSRSVAGTELEAASVMYKELASVIV